MKTIIIIQPLMKPFQLHVFRNLKVACDELNLPYDYLRNNRKLSKLDRINYKNFMIYKIKII